ncbi:FecR family protein [Chitinophaga rupis]|uniref:FecR family protein n=1 Tax=Chitinophaga rupis TaxID=573321 RepID=A0A1H8A3J6_9BACT|nr:FecR domain-containing protein [Chitinophaga rupis]SEM65270.1 FecR family protein [Chitinophaga rupis]
MALSRELYQRFLNGQCTEAEEIMVLQYFSEHPDEMEEYLQTADWEAFEPEQRLHPVVTEKVLDRIRHRITQGKHWQIALRSVAAAALIAGLIALGWMLVGRYPNNNPPAQLAETTPAAVIYRQYNNTGKTALRLVLDDSSTVQLLPGSRLQYRQGFDSTQRALWLRGTARFNVAKDQRRPFTVYAANTATTALGTSFRITADSVTQRVTVKLYSGKVRVQPYGKTIPAFSTQYLQPGDELVYAGHSGKMLVRKTTLSTDKTINNTTDHEQALVYNKRPLPEVLAALEQHFGIQITYNAKALSGIRVTAEFSDTDTPEQVLQTIALLNELTLTRDTAGGYILKK